MFPKMAPNVEEDLKNITETTEVLKEVGRAMKFDFDNNQFVMVNGRPQEISELEAIEQWIKLCLLTYKDKYKVYDGEKFGTNIEDLVGKRLNAFVKSELDREIREGLKNNEQIKDIVSTSYTQKSGTITIEVTVELKNNNLVRVVV